MDYLEEAFEILGVKPRPVCGECKKPMQYAPGASEAHIPPHWYCHEGQIVPDDPNIADKKQETLAVRIAKALEEAEERAKPIDSMIIPYPREHKVVLSGWDSELKRHIYTCLSCDYHMETEEPVSEIMFTRLHMSTLMGTYVGRVFSEEVKKSLEKEGT